MKTRRTSQARRTTIFTVRSPRHLVPLVVAAGLLATASRALGWTTGSSGYAGEEEDETCAECHTPGPMVPSAKLVGPSTLPAGGVGLYQLVVDTDVNSAASVARWVGFEVASSDGKLGTVQQPNQTRILDGSISHTDMVPRTKILGVSFLVTAPPTPGLITLYAAALSTDWTFTVANDTTVTTTLPITIGPADMGAPDLDTMTGATAYPPTPPPVNRAMDDRNWSCATTGTSDASWFAIVLVVLGLRFSTWSPARSPGRASAARARPSDPRCATRC